jgi:hypothetical protein
MDLQSLISDLDQLDPGTNDWRMNFLEMLRMVADEDDCLIQMTIGSDIAHELANDIEFAMLHRVKG